MTVSHQTVRLERGAHRSPDDGACVMELASMLVGAPFSDRPATACPVIGSFLRGYNDAVRPRWRQDLRWCASSVVGTREIGAQRPRVRHLAGAAIAFHDARPPWRRVLGWHRRRRLVRLADAPICEFVLEELGITVAGLLAGSRAGHARAIELVDELVDIGSGQGPSGPRRRARLPIITPITVTR
jgi:hypothetical protein